MDQNKLGIDVSKDNLDVVLWDEQGGKHQIFSNSPEGFVRLAHWLISQKAGLVHACLEATGQYGEGVAEYLYAAGHKVSVVNPLRIKRYGESKLHRNKTDKADASLIAEFCLKENPPLWQPLPEMLSNCAKWCVVWMICSAIISKKAIACNPGWIMRGWLKT